MNDGDDDDDDVCQVIQTGVRRLHANTTPRASTASSIISVTVHVDIKAETVN